MSVKYVRDTEEFFEFTLDERAGQDISADTVTVALAGPGTAILTFLPCTHVTANIWRTTSVVVWSEANYPLRSYKAWGRLTDVPEKPLTYLGTVNITEH